jgi:hypothetical protein
MLFSFLHHAKNDPADKHPLVIVHEQFHSTSEGSEFLYDGLRMEDLLQLLLPRTEECLAAGSPENLL